MQYSLYSFDVSITPIFLLNISLFLLKLSLFFLLDNFLSLFDAYLPLHIGPPDPHPQPPHQQMHIHSVSNSLAKLV